MKYPMYCYRDNKANDFSPPMITQNEETAKRDFDYRLHNDKSMGFSPNDFDLYYVGTFDTANGQIEGILPEFVVNGAELF